MATGLRSQELRFDRVRGDVEVLSRAGLDLDEFLEEAADSLRRAVPWVGACLGTTDPSTNLLTSSRKFGSWRTTTEHELAFAMKEYGEPELTSFATLVASETPAVAVSLAMGEGERSVRVREFFKPYFGFTEEARLVFRDGGVMWGAMALLRGPDDKPFADEDVELLSGLSGAFARGVRTGVLARLAGAPPTDSLGPAVLIVGADDELVQASPGALDRLVGLSGPIEHGHWDSYAALGALVASARRYARGESTVPPRCRVRARDGRWLLLHAAALAGSSDRCGEVVVTIEEARPPEIVALVVAAFGLTARERDVAQLVLQGADTREIASSLFLSTYTVQDHLKSIFEKADVRSRRELISRVFMDQYGPRMGSALAPSGGFA